MDKKQNFNSSYRSRFWLFSTNHKYIGTLYPCPLTIVLSITRSISVFHSRNYIYSNSTRSMFTVNNSSRKVIGNTFLQGLKYVTKDSVLNNITPHDHSPLVESIMEYTVNQQIGTPQHKGAFMFNLFRQKFPVSLFQKALDKQIPDSKIEWPKQGFADSRVVAEIPVVLAIGQDLPFINKLFMSNDLPPSNPNHPNFINRKQANTDLETELKGPYGDKQTYMDVKSGADMVEHTTRGHAGIISFFENQIIPFTTNKQCSSAEIFNRYNSVRVNGIKDVIAKDKPVTDFSPILEEVRRLYKPTTFYPSSYSNNTSSINSASVSSGSSPSLDSILLHNRAQHLLWSKIQCHPDFKRSVGVIFVRTINRLPTDDEYNAYLSRINALLPDGHYNMSKLSDKRLLVSISIKAYLQTVDSQVHKKLEFLANNNIQLDDIVLQLLNDISIGKFTW